MSMTLCKKVSHLSDVPPYHSTLESANRDLQAYTDCSVAPWHKGTRHNPNWRFVLGKAGTH